MYPQGLKKGTLNTQSIITFNKGHDSSFFITASITRSKSCCYWKEDSHKDTQLDIGIWDLRCFAVIVELCVIVFRFRGSAGHVITIWKGLIWVRNSMLPCRIWSVKNQQHEFRKGWWGGTPNQSFSEQNHYLHWVFTEYDVSRPQNKQTPFIFTHSSYLHQNRIIHNYSSSITVSTHSNLTPPWHPEN